MTFPAGAELNLVLQLAAFVLILVGVRYAITTHRAYSSGTEEGSQKGQRTEKTHKNLMTTAVMVSGIGVLIWMVPNLIFGWNYDLGSIPGYGTGGVQSYLSFAGAYLPHWYLIPLMATLGSVTAVLGVYLVLRMRWSGFPRALVIQNFRPVMITTWTLWVLNVLVGIAVFYFFVYVGTG